MIFKRNIGKIKSFCKFCEVSLNIQKIKIKLKIVRAWKFIYIYEYYNIDISDIRSLKNRHKGLKYKYRKCQVQ